MMDWNERLTQQNFRHAVSLFFLEVVNYADRFLLLD